MKKKKKCVITKNQKKKKNSPANAGDMDLIPGLERYSEEGKDNTLQYSCLRNPMDRGSWEARVHVVTEESDTT